MVFVFSSARNFQYILAGGTVDITVHEVQGDGNVKELYKANGGPWGGKSVNEAFLQFLRGTQSMAVYLKHSSTPQVHIYVVI